MTINSEIEKLHTNLSNSYSAVEAKGAVLPQETNFDNLADAISSIEAHAEPVLQDKVIVANGEYTADEGYDGIGTATVAVNATGNTEVATNRTGAAINEGDKVWINQEYYEAGEKYSTTVNGYNSSGSSYGALVLPDGNSVAYYNTSSSPILYDFTTGDSLGVISRPNSQGDSGTGSFGSGSSTCYRYTNGVVYVKSTSGMQRVDSGRGWSKNNWFPIYGSSEYVFDTSDSNNRYIHKINDENGTILASYMIPNETDVSYWSGTSYSSGIVFLDTNHVLIPWIQNSTRRVYLLSLDDTTNSATVVKYYTSNALNPVGAFSITFPVILGITSDKKYLIQVTCSYSSSSAKVEVFDLTDIDNTLTNVASRFPELSPLKFGQGADTRDAYTAAVANQITYDPQHNLLWSPVYLYVSSSQQPYTLRYNPENETFTVVNIDYTALATEAGASRFIGFSGDLDAIWFNGGSNNRPTKLAITRSLGNYLIKYTNSSEDTVTGTAAESISVGASGNVYLGARSKLQQEKIIRQNGTYTADIGYDGMAAVDVGVGQIGETYEAVNRSGNNLAANDKVWLTYRQSTPDTSESLTGKEWAVFNYGNDDLLYLSISSSNLYNLLTGSYTTVASSAYPQTIWYENGKTYLQGTTTKNIHFEADGSVETDWTSDGSYQSQLSFINGRVRIWAHAGSGYPHLYIDETHVAEGSYMIYYMSRGGSFCWEHNNKVYLITRCNFDKGQDGLVLYTIDLDNKTITRKSTITAPGAVYEGNCYGLTSDKKYIIYTNYERSGFVKINYSNDTISDATGSCGISLSVNYFSFYNPVGKYLVVQPISITNAKDCILYKYNETNEVFEEQTDFRFPDTNITAGIKSISINNTASVVTIYRYNNSSYTRYLDIFKYATNGGWVIVPYDTTVQDSLTGYAESAISAGATGNVIVGTKITSTLVTKTITENGTYSASSDSADGFSEVTVDVGTVTAVNNSSYDRENGEKVWLYESNGNYSIVNALGLTSHAFTGICKEPIAIGSSGIVQAAVGGELVTRWTRNFTTYGSTVIDDAARTADIGPNVNYYAGAYKLNPTAFGTANTSYEFTTKIKWYDRTGNDQFSSGAQIAVGQDMNAKGQTQLIRFDYSDGLKLNYCRAASDYGAATLVTTSNFVWNSWYWIKAVVTSSSIVVSYSTDGTNWIEAYNYNSGQLFNLLSTANFAGFAGQTNKKTMFDLGETLFKADDTVIYQPYIPTTE